MSLFNIEFHDGRTFYNLINIICKVTGSCQLTLKRDHMKIETFNGLKTVAIKVDFDIDYIKNYYLNEDYEVHFVNFKNSSLPSKGSMKRNDTLILSQDLDTNIINVMIVSDSRTSEGGKSYFHNGENFDEERLEFPNEKEFTKCKMKLDRLCEIFKHSIVANSCKASFNFYKNGLRIDMKDTQGKTVWSSGENYSGIYHEVEVEKNIISELTKLNTLHNESMCLISAYEDGGLLRVKTPVSCFGTLQLYLIENDKENDE